MRSPSVLYESGNIGQTVRAREYFTKAFALRDHTSEREKLDIAALYYSWVTGDLAKADQTWQEYMQEYPRDDLPTRIWPRIGE